MPRKKIARAAPLALLAGGASLLLAGLGLYGLMASSVSRRTGEIGLRMALGARPRDVVPLVLGQGLAFAAAGLGVGVASAWAPARLLGATLYRVSPTDRTTFLVVVAVLGTAAVAASWLPARRATRIDPMAALRCE